MEVSINTNAMKVNYEQKPCYDIVFSKDFNLLNDEIQQLNISNKRICIVTESNVGPLYANEVKDIFMSNSKEVIIFEFTAGEAHKNLDTISELYTVLIENKFDRNDMLVRWWRCRRHDRICCSNLFKRNRFYSNSNFFISTGRFKYWWKNRCRL